MPKSILLIVLCLIVACSSTGSSSGQAQFEIEEAFPGLPDFDSPVDIQYPGDGTDRLFVVEQDGVIRVFANDPTATTTEVFLDIDDRVRSGGERGLLGLAFHPNYAENGYFFVDYTASGPDRTVIARYRVDPNDSNRADPESETVILEVEQPFSNHNAGQIVFGPDGYLYVSLGDGGSGGDPEENGQDRSTLLGSLLRIDVDNPSGDRNYGIPDDNPFVAADCGPAGCREEIWAYGLRNPWRFSFDLETGRLWAADVGQNQYEEIDIIEKGGNYGWNTMEGMHCFDPPAGCDQSGLILPVWEYSHSLGQSITGGFVYRGPTVPELTGRYIYADFGSGRIWALNYDGAAAENTLLIDTSLNISTFGVDQDRELYFAAFDGQIYRFTPTTNTSTGEAEVPEAPAHLRANHPNPFREATTLTYTLGHPAPIELSIYDVRGRRVRTLADAVQPAGEHAVRWDGRSDAGVPLAGGVYVCRLLVAGVAVATQRLVRLP